MTRRKASERVYLLGYFNSASYELLSGFSLVSVCPHSVPGSGSPCQPIEALLRARDRRRAEFDPPFASGVILHGSGDVTFKTDKGFVRFWADRIGNV